MEVFILSQSYNESKLVSYRQSIPSPVRVFRLPEMPLIKDIVIKQNNGAYSQHVIRSAVALSYKWSRSPIRSLTASSGAYKNAITLLILQK